MSFGKIAAALFGSDGARSRSRCRRDLVVHEGGAAISSAEAAPVPAEQEPVTIVSINI